MKTNQKENAATTVANACQKLAGRIEKAREQFLAELRETFAVPEKMFRLALREAEALAWQTSYPQLVFPDLAMEKVRAVAAWHDRQQFPGRRRIPAKLVA